MKKIATAVSAMGMLIALASVVFAEETKCPQGWSCSEGYRVMGSTSAMKGNLVMATPAIWEIASVVFSPRLPGEGISPHVELHFKDSNNQRPDWKKRAGERDVSILLVEFGGNEAIGLIGAVFRDCQDKNGVVGEICRTP